jgi:hypothetical protein
MKKVNIFLSLFVLVIFISSFSKDKKTTESTVNLISTLNYNVPTEQESFITEDFQIPFLGNNFNGFREALAFKESQGKYHKVNTLGYLGKYQFGKSTLERFKIYDTQLFLKSPELQEDAFLALCSVNKWILRKDIKRSVGKRINGIEITESGILAAAHLGGAGNVKKYLRSGGVVQFKDAYGSSIQHYIKKFSGYNTSFVEANRKPIL